MLGVYTLPPHRRLAVTLCQRLHHLSIQPPSPCQATAPFLGLRVMPTPVASARSLHHPLRVSLHPLLSFVNCPFLKLSSVPHGGILSVMQEGHQLRRLKV